MYDQFSNVVWTENPSGNAGEALMQMDGNFVLYDGSTPYWSTDTHVNYGAYLVVQNDGNIVVYSLSGSVLWSRF